MRVWNIFQNDTIFNNPLWEKLSWTNERSHRYIFLAFLMTNLLFSGLIVRPKGFSCHPCSSNNIAMTYCYATHVKNYLWDFEMRWGGWQFILRDVFKWSSGWQKNCLSFYQSFWKAPLKKRRRRSWMKAKAKLIFNFIIWISIFTPMFYVWKFWTIYLERHGRRKPFGKLQILLFNLNSLKWEFCWEKLKFLSKLSTALPNRFDWTWIFLSLQFNKPVCVQIYWKGNWSGDELGERTTSMSNTKRKRKILDLIFGFPLNLIRSSRIYQTVSCKQTQFPSI